MVPFSFPDVARGDCVFSIIVCCYNSEKRLGHVYEAIAQAQVSEPFEVIVVDNNSTDNTGRYARSLRMLPRMVGLNVVFEPRQGLGFAREAGLRQAAGKFICFLDDDNLLPSGYLEAVKSVFDMNPSVGIVGAGSRLPENQVAPGWFSFFGLGFAVGQQHSSPGVLGAGGFLWGAGVCLRAHAVTQLLSAGWEPILSGRVKGRLVSGDDAELVHCLGILGWQKWYLEDYAITHVLDPGKFRIKQLIQLFSGFGHSALMCVSYREADRRLNRGSASPLVDHQRRTGPVSAALRANGLRALKYVPLFWICKSAFYAACLASIMSPSARKQLVRVKQQIARLSGPV